MRALDSTAKDFIALVAQVKPTQWQDPTPCEQWDVRALVGHVISSMHFYAELLHGASASRAVELRKQQETIGGDDLLMAVTDAAAQAYAAFAEPGALERSVHHPMGDLPGSQLLRMRVVDNVVHGWDLATALHLPAVIDAALAEDLYQGLVPMADGLVGTGYIAAPRRPLHSDADPQERLLTLLGR
jgi:uncharacterized protein (TIGR03086 family)